MIDYLVFLSLGIFLGIERFSFYNLEKYTKRDVLDDVKFFIFLEYIFPRIAGYGVFDALSKRSGEIKTWLNISQFHFIIQFAMVLVVSDFLNWLIHYLFHRLSWLWEFHKIHHSPEWISVLTGKRRHFVEDLIFPISNALTFILLGPRIELFVACGIIGLFYSDFIHTNTKLDLKVLEFVFVTPKIHSWHHAEELKCQYGQNFGGIFVFWDKLFSTFYQEDDMPSRIGLSLKQKIGTGFLDQLLSPFRSILGIK